MNHPWGLSGPAFLWLYAGGFVLAAGAALSLRHRARGAALTESARVSSVVALGFLVGGARRAAEVVFTRLLDAGAVHLSRSGALVRAESDVADPLDRAALERVGKRRDHVADAIAAIAVHPKVTGLRDELAEQGFVLSAQTERTGRLRSTIPGYLLAAVGVVRWLQGMAEHLPVGYLTVFLLATGVGLVGLHTWRIPARTTAGTAVAAAGGDHPALAGLDLTGAAGLVALDGLDAHPDEKIAAAVSSSVGSGAAAAVATCSFSPVTQQQKAARSYHNYGGHVGGGGSGFGGGCGGGSR
jgi:uncharacterized protein (TIGR04222 family)